MRILRLAIISLVVAATAVVLVAMNTLMDRYHARQAQEASREFTQRLLGKQLAPIPPDVEFYAGYFVRPGALPAEGPTEQPAVVVETAYAAHEAHQSLSGAAEDLHGQVTGYLRTRGLERARQATPP